MCPQPMLCNAIKIYFSQKVYVQQAHLRMGILLRRILVQNWIGLQDFCNNSTKIEKYNYAWIKCVLRYLWNFSHDIWVFSCIEINKKEPKLVGNLNQIKLIKLIHTYLRINWDKLSIKWKKINLNVACGIVSAHYKTLMQWLQIINLEREAKIRQKRESNWKGENAQQITKCCVPRSSWTNKSV